MESWRGVTSLSAAFQALSPRLNPRATPWHSLAIHAGVIAFFVALLAQAFIAQGVWAWSVGVAYVGYDTLAAAVRREPAVAALAERARADRGWKPAEGGGAGRRTQRGRGPGAVA